MATDKLVHIVPVAPFPGAIGFPFSQTAPNVEQDVTADEAAELVASGAFRLTDPPPPSARKPIPTEAPQDAGPSDSAADAADERSETA
jgi:hypothetical protein